MLGFAAIAELAIAEPLGSGVGVETVVPTATVSIAGAAPVILTGAAVQPPAATVVVAGVAPSIRAGVTLEVPTASVVISGIAPVIAIGETVLVPTAAAISISANDPSVHVGAAVLVGSIIDTLAYGGGIGEAAVGEFAVGEGPEVSFSGIAPYGTLIRVQANAPEIKAGVRLLIPAASIIVQGNSPEIIARRRRVSFFAIAS